MAPRNPLRTGRILLALFFFCGLSLLLAGVSHPGWSWMTKLQLLPSVYRLIGGFTIGNLAVLCLLLALTGLFGRIYCSVICPLGVFQDVFIRLRRWLERLFPALRSHRKSLERPASPHQGWRIATLALILGSLLICGQLLISWVAPYSAYGRMVHAAAGLASGQSIVPALLWVAGGTALVIILCAVFSGRGWCNTVCPVGTVLGFLSARALLRIRIDADKCIGCGQCSRQCKSRCIDVPARRVDASRCVDCFDCLGACKVGAIRYGRATPESGARTPDTMTAGNGSPKVQSTNTSSADSAAATSRQKKQETDAGRRHFLATGSALLGAAVLARAEGHTDGGLAPVTAKQAPPRGERLVPPGAGSVPDFYARCTACQLCVSNCPNGVLQASTDLGHLLQPYMNYADGWCRPECTACSQVCPAGAIRPVQRDEKTAIRIGSARVQLDACLAYAGKAGCGNCERHCPSGAITMVEADGHRFPVVAESQCTGCGACEYLCPVRPVSAITVEGLHVHQSK